MIRDMLVCDNCSKQYEDGGTDCLTNGDSCPECQSINEEGTLELKEVDDYPD